MAIMAAVLAIVGLYFLFFHKDPLPLNHEAIGLGTRGSDILSTTHIIHDIIGLILIGGAVLVWRKSRAITPAPSPTAK